MVFLINFQPLSVKITMHTNHAIMFGHTQIKEKETENINACSLCSSHAVLLLFYLLHIIGHFLALLQCMSGQPLSRLWFMQ
jgi:hypothetical protein